MYRTGALNMTAAKFIISFLVCNGAPARKKRGGPGTGPARGGRDARRGTLRLISSPLYRYPHRYFDCRDVVARLLLLRSEAQPFQRITSGKDLSQTRHDTPAGGDVIYCSCPVLLCLFGRIRKGRGAEMLQGILQRHKAEQGFILREAVRGISLCRRQAHFFRNRG